MVVELSQLKILFTIKFILIQAQVFDSRGMVRQDCWDKIIIFRLSSKNFILIVKF